MTRQPPARRGPARPSSRCWFTVSAGRNLARRRPARPRSSATTRSWRPWISASWVEPVIAGFTSTRRPGRTSTEIRVRSVPMADVDRDEHGAEQPAGPLLLARSWSPVRMNHAESCRRPDAEHGHHGITRWRGRAGSSVLDCHGSMDRTTLGGPDPSQIPFPTTGPQQRNGNSARPAGVRCRLPCLSSRRTANPHDTRPSSRAARRGPVYRPAATSVRPVRCPARTWTVRNIRDSSIGRSRASLTACIRLCRRPSFLGKHGRAVWGVSRYHAGGQIRAVPASRPAAEAEVARAVPASAAGQEP